MRIVSGGQTGVDRAALDAAMDCGFETGGWCPRGRRSEDGTIPAHYDLVETRSPFYTVRTRWNVRDSDGTLVLCRGEATGGTQLTVEAARKAGKPCLVRDLGARRRPRVDTVVRWIEEHRIETLNVAGPRESTAPGITPEATKWLKRLFTALSAR